MQSDPATQEVIRAISTAFGNADSGNTHDVPKSRVLAWMELPNLEVRGALYSKIADPKLARFVKPPLGLDDCFHFVLSYLEQCMLQDPDSQWADSRYGAGTQLVGWIRRFWEDKAIPREMLAEVKRRLAALYALGDRHMRDALVNAVLEHLFESPELSSFFEDWKDDPELRTAYLDAMAWTKEAPPGFADRIADIERMRRREG